MKHKTKMFVTIITMPTLYLGFFYLLWIFKDHDQGRSVTGIVMSILIGCVFIYSAEALVHYGKGRSGQATLSLVMASLFGHLWYNSITTLSNSFVTGEPCPIAGYNVPGWFGIEGFWGLGIIVPIWFSVIFVICLIGYLWDKYDPWWEIKYRWKYRKGWQERRHLKNKLKAL